MKHASNWTLARIGKTVLTLVAAAIGAAVLMNSSCNLTNKAPTVPVITGPSSDVVGVAVTFKATATDPDNDSIAFQFDWGDTTTPAWSSFVASGETLSLAHTYSDSGTFLVKAKAKDAKDKESGWCTAESIHISTIVRDYPDSVYEEISTADRARAGAITPDGQYLYVVHNDGENRVTPIRLADRVCLPPIILDAEPFEIVSSVDGSHVYVTLYHANRILSIRTSDNTIDRDVSVVKGPRSLAVTPDGQFLLVTTLDPDPGFLVFLNASDLTVVDTVFPGLWTDFVVIDDAGQRGYTTTYGGIRVLDIPSRTIVDSIPAVPNGGFLKLSRDGQFLYATSFYDTGFAVVRLADRSLTNLVKLQHTVGDLATTRNGHYLVASSLFAVLDVDTRSYAVVDSLAFPGENRPPLVMHPTTDTMYVIGYKKVYVVGPRQ